ncbi:MAG: hypothetical protein R3C14_02670 [Caldilineaceae bacterium]
MTAPKLLQSDRVTVSAHPSGDKLNMLVNCSVFAMQHGMIWVGVADGSRLGIFFGAAGCATHEPPSEMPSAQDKLTGEMLGRRVARLTRRLHSTNRHLPDDKKA